MMTKVETASATEFEKIHYEKIAIRADICTHNIRCPKSISI